MSSAHKAFQPEHCDELLKQFMSCFRLCSTDQARTLSVSILHKICLLAESASGCQISDDKLWSIAGDVHLGAPLKLKYKSRNRNLILSQPDSDQSFISSNQSNLYLKPLIMVEIILNPWTPAHILQETWSMALKLYMAQTQPLLPTFKILFKSLLQDRLISGTKYQCVSNHSSDLEKSLVKLHLDRYQVFSGPMGVLSDKSYRNALLDGSFLSISHADLIVVEFMYRFHPNTILSRVAARHLLTEFSTCISQCNWIESADQLQLKQTIYSFFDKFMPHATTSELVEIIAVMMLFPPESLKLGRFISHPISQSKTYHYVQPSIVAQIVEILQEWILSQHLQSGQVCLWSLHPWLLASLSSAHSIIFEAYVKHLIKLLANIQRFISDSFIASNQNADWASEAVDIRTKLLLLWKLVSDPCRQYLAQHIQSFTDDLVENQSASIRNFWKFFIGTLFTHSFNHKQDGSM
ncbi:hypothetical protein BDV3_002457 [Batrachochytrium dendrobatidis]